MAVREKISRLNLIIKKLRRNPATWREIEDHLAQQSEFEEYDFNISKRTFERDIIDIRELYNFDIQHNRSQRVYHINFDEQSQANERILEAFDTFNALNLTDRLSQYIHFEKRRKGVYCFCSIEVQTSYVT